MSELLVVGVSHRSASVEVRERLAVGRGQLPEQLQGLVTQGLQEGVLVSTCNRVELYGASEDAGAALQAARNYFERRGDLDGSLYTHRGIEAVRHTFRVAASLDSMVVGEPQILGQIKEAYEAATDAGTVGMLLGRCFTRAFSVAKRVRSETGIAEGTVSVSSIATSLATKIFGELHGRRVLFLGAGEMGEAAAKTLAGSGAKLVVVNRSPQKAIDVANGCGGEARGYEHLATELVAADVVITSTSSKSPVLTAALMKDVVRTRRHRPLFLIDIAVPRDVEPKVGDLENVFLYDVDDLQQVAEENLSHRRRAADAAERIVDIEVSEFEAWRRSLDLTPTIVGLRDRFSSIVTAELERTLPRLGDLSPKDRKALERMGTSLVNKLLHAPLTSLKAGSREADGAALISTTRRLFDLDEAPEAREAAPTKALEPAKGR